MIEGDKEKFLEGVKRDIGDAENTQNNASDTFSYFVYGLFLAVVVVILVIFGLEKAKASKVTTLNEAIQTEVTAPLKSLAKEQKTSEDLVKQLDVLSTALTGRLKLDQFMGDMRSSQYKTSLWSAFTYQGEKVAIQGSTSSYEDVGKSVAAFRGMKAVKDVALMSVNQNEETGKIDFSVELTVDNSLYKYLPTTQTQTKEAS